MKKKNNVLLIIIIVIAALVVVGGTIFLVFKNMSIASDNKEYNNLASSVVAEETTEEMTAPSINEQLAENPIDFKTLQETNEEIYSWIYFPDTNINYPVCQSMSDDNFYINHDVYKNYSFAGTIYSQVCNKKDYSDRVTVLYGHNMANHTMFADLHKFEDSEFFDSHDKFYVYTPDRKLTYEVVSAFVYDDRHIMNSFDFSKDDVFQEYLDLVANPRSVTKNVRDGVELDLNSKILTLSTCLDSGEGRYLLQGVLIKDEKTK